MTREEAIEQLQNCKGLIKQDGKDWLDERDIPLLDMAITALQGGDAEVRNDRTYINEPYMQQSPNNGADLISRADAIEAVESANPKDKEYHYYKHFAVEALEEIPSAEFPKGDLVSMEQVIELVDDMFYHIPKEGLLAEIKALQSADAENDDLIIKGAKGIQDGLYNIKDGKLFMYKANGGTVRTYPIVPSADKPHHMPFGEWREIEDDEGLKCSVCGHVFGAPYDYCPHCGARMMRVK